ncbi:SPFH domain-containing protein [Raineyella sp. LH-20]|uniref:SPFH domain-containing protein n=1 Tax=Raineyella sp. LH-20 TaxID=3081204 RepID=UPI002955A68D|nr:SPFH domain-containing protein [Raineyella sp. LH-20]WOP17833.1 SPFH domain-containing protein [Raineyella sp. LH-20]
MREFTAGLFGRRVTLAPWERAVTHRDGVISQELGPGRYRLPRRTTAMILDVRPRQLVVNAQEILTTDAVSVRVSAVADVTVTDARAAVTESPDCDAVLYQAIQLALREAITTRTLTEVLADRAAMSSALLTPARSAATRVGLDVSMVAVRDLTLAQDARAVLAEAALEAQRSKAVLERARAEVAATRAMANAARILADNPALLQLRMAQSPGATVVVNTGIAQPANAIQAD